MTGPGSRVTPARILSFAAAALLLFVLLLPQERTNRGGALSSYSAGPVGARGFYEVLGRLGYPVRRHTKPLTPSLDSGATYVVLSPAEPLTTVERSDLVTAVRKGAVLLFTVGTDELSDSLGFVIRPAEHGFHTLRDVTVPGGGPRHGMATTSTFLPIVTTLQSSPPGHDQAFMWLSDSVDSQSVQALVLGHNLGRGYVIGLVPPELLTNQLLGDGYAAVAMVRALEVANERTHRATGSRPVIFDEYHHGFGRHANIISAVEAALTDTPAGRMAIQAIIAALILLIAFGSRPISPAPATLISRRSPLEHVDALAHAYLQVDARALGADRLLNGLRRRHPLGIARSVSHLQYLAVLRSRVPEAALHADRVEAALQSNSSDRFATIGAAVANIERAFQK